MGDRYHVEAWSLPLATTQLIVARVPFIKGSFAPKISAAGRGAISVRKDWDRLDDVTDPDAGTGSLFRVYQDSGTDPVFSFFGRRDSRNLADDATDLAVISGPGIGDVMNFARVENFDYPVSPTIDPNWSWGAGGAIRGFQNGSFEESDPGKYDVGSGFEDENLAGWKSMRTGEEGINEDVVSPDSPPTVTNTDPRTGTFAMEFDPADGGSMGGPSGIQRSIPGWGGEQLTVALWVKAVAGERIICGIGPYATASHTNAFDQNDISWAELGNVAEGTGSTDGTYQQFLLDVVTEGPMRSQPAEITVYIQYVDNGDIAVINVDDVIFNGYGIGLQPWEPGPKDQPQTPSTFHQRNGLPGPAPPVTPFDGAAVIQQVYTGTGPAGATQPIEGVTVGRVYTGLAQIHHDTGSAQDFLIRFRRGSSGETYASATISVPTGGTWTPITVTGEAPEEDIFLSVLKVTAGEWWTDASRLFDGQASASWGEINTELLDDAAVDHTGEASPFQRDTLGFLDYTSYTDLLDSAGNGWAPALVDYRAPRGKKYYQHLVEGTRMGFEWQVVDLTASGPRLDLFNPHDWSTRTGGMGVSRVGTDVPALRYGPGVVGGPIIRQPSTVNRVHIEGEGGLFEVRRDSGSITNYDTRELYEGNTDFLDSATIGQVADQTLDERVIPTTALKVQLAPHESDDVPIPFRDFNLGDTYPVDLIGDFTGEKRVVGITTDFTPGFGLYTVEFDQATYTTDPLKAVTEAVRRLMEQAEALPAPADTSRGAVTVTLDPDDPTFAGPVENDYLVAAVDARADLKAVADFVCDGTDDRVQINAAWTAIEGDGSAGGGRVVLSPGTFNTGGQVTMNPDQGQPGEMVGAGKGATIIKMSSGSGTSAVRVRAGSTIRDLSILVDSSATVTRGALEIDESDSQAINVAVDTDDGVGIWCDGPRARVEGCDVIARIDATHGIFVHADASQAMILTNTIHEARQHGIMIDGDSGGTGELTQVLGNRVINPSRQTADTYDGIHMEGPFAADHGPLIEENIIYKTGGGDFRDGINVGVANVVDVTIGVNTVGAGVGRWAISLAGVGCAVNGGRYMGGINVPGDDNHITGAMIAIVNDASNGIVVGGDRNSIMGNKVYPQSGTIPAIGLEILSGATDNVVGHNDLEQTTTLFSDSGTSTVVL